MSDAYFAGLFDGEGSIGIYRTSNGKGTNEKKFYTVKFAIVGTYLPMIRAAYDYFGEGLFTTQKRQKLIQTPRGTYSLTGESTSRLCKQGWKWAITDKRGIKNVLERIVPFLIEKRKQVEVVLDYLNDKLDGETALQLCKEAKGFDFPVGDFEEYKSPRMENKRGERNSSAKLTNDQVKEIRDGYNQERSTRAYAKEMAIKYNMSVSGMEKVIIGTSYRWI